MAGEGEGEGGEAEVQPAPASSGVGGNADAKGTSVRFCSYPDLESERPGGSASARRKLAMLQRLESLRFQLAIVGLVVLDILLFFMESVESVKDALTPTLLLVLQVLIAGVFVLEMLAKVYVYGWRRFSGVSSNMIDTFIVVVTTLGTIVQVIEFASSSDVQSVSDLSQGSTLVRVVRVVRLFRLFRVYRVYDAFHSVSRRRVTSIAPVTPNARAVDILQRMKQCLLTSSEFQEYVRPVEIQWVLDVVRKNLVGVAVVNRVEEEDEQYLQSLGISLPHPEDVRHASSHALVARPAAPRVVLTWEEVCGKDAGDPDAVERVIDKTLGDWGFDVFLAAKLSGGHPLRVVGFGVFRAFKLGEFLSVGDHVIVGWLDAMEEGYLNNPYHNSTHAADVLQTLYWLLVHLDLAGDLGELQVCALVVAAVVHDYGHLGVNNNFLVKTSHELAVRYNDISVLEAHSIAASFLLTERGDVNIFREMSGDDYKELRRIVFGLVLKTDMSFHFDIIGAFEAQEQDGFDLMRAKDADTAMTLLLHCADISNPTKPWDIASRWTKSVVAEFRQQGRREIEEGLPVSKFMEPEGGPLEEAQCQFLFIDIFVEPLWGALWRFVELVRPSHVSKMRLVFDCIKQNKRVHEHSRHGGHDHKPLVPTPPSAARSPSILRKPSQVARRASTLLARAKQMTSPRAKKDGERPTPRVVLAKEELAREGTKLGGDEA